MFGFAYTNIFRQLWTIIIKFVWESSEKNGRDASAVPPRRRRRTRQRSFSPSGGLSRHRFMFVVLRRPAAAMLWHTCVICILRRLVKEPTNMGNAIRQFLLKRTRSNAHRMSHVRQANENKHTALRAPVQNAAPVPARRVGTLSGRAYHTHLSARCHHLSTPAASIGHGFQPSWRLQPELSDSL